MCIVFLSTLFFQIFGIENWRVLACVWAMLPFYNVYNFMTCPIERLTDEGKGLKIKELFTTPMFWLFMILMIGAGASEASMAQWASAYVESALGFSKNIGDITGPCVFVVSIGLSRVIYGKYGQKINLSDYLWLFRWNYVAGYNQCGIKQNASGRNRIVCAACYGRRFWRFHRSRCRRYCDTKGKQ